MEDRVELAYADALRTLAMCVSHKVMEAYQDADESGARIYNVHQHIATDSSIDDKRRQFIDIFIDNGQALLDRVVAARTLVDDGSELDSPEVEDEVLEEFTGNWLALYFLGVPFVQLWESVAFFAEGSGFPRASVCKAAGDVYRRARKMRARVPPPPAASLPVYVLDHNPLTIWKTTNAGEKPETTHVIYRLGTLYEILQLRLYLQTGGPICYYVPLSSLKRALVGTPEEMGAKAGFMWDLMTSTFPDRFKDVQAVHIVDDEDLSIMPGCVVGPVQGIFRSRESSPGHGLPKRVSPGRAGNFLATRISGDFRGKLGNVKTPGPTLQEVPRDAFTQMCLDMIAA